MATLYPTCEPIGMPHSDTYIKVKDAAELLGVSPNTIRNWGRDNRLPEYRHPLNNYRLFKRSDLQKVLRKLQKPLPSTARTRKPR